jgi:hypothetical protein
MCLGFATAIDTVMTFIARSDERERNWEWQNSKTAPFLSLRTDAE